MKAEIAHRPGGATNFHRELDNGRKNACNQAIKVASDEGRRADPGKGARFASRDCGAEGIKQHGSGREWFAGEGKIGRLSSKSAARKFASAMIAKIPPVLSRWIGKVFIEATSH